MKKDREIRDRVGRFMLAHGLHMGDKVDAGKVQDMLAEYVTKFSARQHTALVRGCASLGAQNVLLKAENARLRRLQQGGDWVSVKERGYPEIGKWCWVVWRGVVQRQAAHLSSEGWEWAEAEADHAPKEVITHWQYIPAPPAAEPEREG